MIKQLEDGILVTIRIAPNSSKNEILIDGDPIKIKITAQPVENKANKALTEFLSEYLKIPKTSIKIVRGHTGKDKSIMFLTYDIQKQNEIIHKLTK